MQKYKPAFFLVFIQLVITGIYQTALYLYYKPNMLTFSLADISAITIHLLVSIAAMIVFFVMKKNREGIAMVISILLIVIIGSGTCNSIMRASIVNSNEATQHLNSLIDSLSAQSGSNP